MRILKKIIKSKIFIIIVSIFIILSVLWWWPAKSITPEYGFTFSAKYAKELKHNPENALEQIFSELNMKKVRLVAYWDDIEKEQGTFDFSELDEQINIAEKYDAEVILAIGKRVPRWPECHVPDWALHIEQSDQNSALEKYLEQVVLRYKDREVIKMWQVENEPFLTSYAKQYCSGFDKGFFEKEINLVKSLDPDRPILLTDSGELSLWYSTYSRADHFGSTFYVYVANYFFEDVRSIMSHNTYAFKRNAMELFFGKKPSYLIEVSIEPWLTKPIIMTSFSEQLSKMNVERAETIINIASKTGFEVQYLWGPEWWLYLKNNGYPDLWNYFKELNREQ